MPDHASEKPARLSWIGWLESALMAAAGFLGLYIALILLSWEGGMEGRSWNTVIGLTSLLGGLAAIIAAGYLLHPLRSKRIRIGLAVLFFLILPGILWAMFLIRGH